MDPWPQFSIPYHMWTPGLSSPFPTTCGPLASVLPSLPHVDPWPQFSLPYHMWTPGLSSPFPTTCGPLASVLPSLPHVDPWPQFSLPYHMWTPGPSSPFPTTCGPLASVLPSLPHGDPPPPQAGPVQSCSLGHSPSDGVLLIDMHFLVENDFHQIFHNVECFAASDNKSAAGLTGFQHKQCNESPLNHHHFIFMLFR